MRDEPVRSLLFFARCVSKQAAASGKFAYGPTLIGWPHRALSTRRAEEVNEYPAGYLSPGGQQYCNDRHEDEDPRGLRVHFSVFRIRYGLVHVRKDKLVTTVTP